MSRMYLVRLLLFFNDTATTEIYTLSLHDALPIFRAHAELPSLCEHVHLPLQSGSSRILKAMRRTYTRERYLDRVRLIREHVPDAAITTDVIVGFPGETEEDFADRKSVV